MKVTKPQLFFKLDIHLGLQNILNKTQMKELKQKPNWIFFYKMVVNAVYGKLIENIKEE